MAFKTQKEYEDAKKKWRSSILQARSPAGYNQFLSDESGWLSAQAALEEYKKEQGKAEAAPAKEAEPAKTPRSEYWEGLIADAKSRSTPKSLNTEKKVLTSKDLPDRPGKPKLPNMTISGSLVTDKIAKPSGKSGEIAKYASGPSNLSKKYPSAKTQGAGNLANYKKKIKAGK